MEAICQVHLLHCSGWNRELPLLWAGGKLAVHLGSILGDPEDKQFSVANTEVNVALIKASVSPATAIREQGLCGFLCTCFPQFDQEQVPPVVNSV